MTSFALSYALSEKQRTNITILCLAVLLAAGMLLQGERWLLSSLCCGLIMWLVWKVHPYAKAKDVGNKLIPALLLLLAMPANCPPLLACAAGITLVCLTLPPNRQGRKTLFNPPMASWCLILWLFPYAGDFSSFFGIQSLDALSQATPLSSKPVAQTWQEWVTAPSLFTTLIPWEGLTPWTHEWLQWLALLLGSLLCLLRIIDWAIPATFLATSTLLFVLAEDMMGSAPFYYYWLLGGGTIAAFFTLTDPSSSASTRLARCFTAAIAGILVALLRIYYEIEAVAVGVVLANWLGPLASRQPWHILRLRLRAMSSIAPLRQANKLHLVPIAIIVLSSALSFGVLQWAVSTAKKPSQALLTQSWQHNPQLLFEVFATDTNCRLIVHDSTVEGYGGAMTIQWIVEKRAEKYIIVPQTVKHRESQVLVDSILLWYSKSKQREQMDTLTAATLTQAAFDRSHLNLVQRLEQSPYKNWLQFCAT